MSREHSQGCPVSSSRLTAPVRAPPRLPPSPPPFLDPYIRRHLSMMQLLTYCTAHHDANPEKNHGGLEHRVPGL